MLIAESLTKRFQGSRTVDAVGGIDFSIEPGEFVAIVGRSGSGKSTLLAMLGGLTRPTSGAISIDKINQWNLKNNAHSDFRNQKIGFVFQFASLLPSLRALDNVALPGLISGLLTDKEAYNRARALLEQVGLGERADFYPNQLSGGEQRRVAIARALINSPEVLLADEPTADLDEETEAEILNLLIAIRAANNLTLVVVTHNMDIAGHADRVFQMRAGLIVSNAPRPASRTEQIDTDERRGGAPCGPSAAQQAVHALGACPLPPQLTGRESAMRLATAEQVERIQRIFDQQSAPLAQDSSVTLGAGIERFIGQLIMLTVPLIGVFWLINFGIAQVENHFLAEQVTARQAIEDLAMVGLRAEVKDVTMGPENSYDVAIYLRNTSGTAPIYVLTPSVRGFVQVGSSWQEVSMVPADPAAPKVMKVTGEQVNHYILKPNIDDYAQLLPNYMHVRLSNEMLVSGSSQPKTDLVERSDNYYVYLKPHDASDEAILKKLKFPGKPPVWIPMPPH